MRTYAPASTESVLASLLEEPSIARGVVHHRHLPREGGGVRRRARRGWIRGSGRASQRAASSGSTPTRRRRSRRSTPARTSSSSRRPRRARRSATRCRSSRRSPTTRPRGRCSCSRRRRSARTRSRSSRSCRGRPGCRSRRRRTTATRRPRSGRRSAKAGQVVVTNPDMLNSAILPHHTKWFQLFEQLRVIVIDELHTYRGVFGSHVANVIRRLLRLCAHYGSHAGDRLLLGDDREPGGAGGDADRPAVAARSTGTARRRGERHVLLVDPPVIDAATGARGSAAHARQPLGAAVPAGRPPDDRLRPGADAPSRSC